MNMRREAMVWSIAVTLAIALGLVVVWAAIALAYSQQNFAPLYYVAAPYSQDDYSAEGVNSARLNPLDLRLEQEVILEDQISGTQVSNPAIVPPVSNPPVTEPPSINLPVTVLPPINPPVTEPPPTNSPATELPPINPPVTEQPIKPPKATKSPKATKPPKPVKTIKPPRKPPKSDKHTDARLITDCLVQLQWASPAPLPCLLRPKIRCHYLPQVVENNTPWLMDAAGECLL